jgi:glutamate racemase
MLSTTKLGPIGVFDSGYGGLTILQEMRALLPAYDFLYLGDNARAPYGTRSFDVVYEFTRQAVQYLFDQGCPLVILACNTASAKALRTIQQCDLPLMGADRRVLGVIRPTVEALDELSTTKHIGILGTAGTISSESYPIEINKMFQHIEVAAEACPMWVPLVENNEFKSDGADYFIQKHLQSILAKDPQIDTLVLACTHYPLLIDKITANLSPSIRVISQGAYVAASLKDYLERHAEMDKRLLRNGACEFRTTEAIDKFSEAAALFLKETIQAERVSLG